MFKKLLRLAWNRTVRRKEWVQFKSIHFENGRLDILARHPAMGLILEEIIKFYRDVGGPNYVEMTLFDPVSMGTYVVTIVPPAGNTPHDVAQLYKVALESILADPQRAEEIAKGVLKQ